MIERVCQGLNKMGAAKYAQAVVRDVLSDVAIGSYHGIDHTDAGLRQVESILKRAATDTLHYNGFLSTAIFSQHLVGLRPKDSPVAEIIDDLAVGLSLAAAKRV